MRIARQYTDGETREDVLDASLRCLAFLFMAGMASSLLSPARLDNRYIDIIRVVLLSGCGACLARCFYQIILEIRRHGWSHSTIIAFGFTLLAAAIIAIISLSVAVYWGIDSTPYHYERI